MKIRKNFVSNSSSSNYICDVCGESEYSWDFPDWAFNRCNGYEHYYCKEHETTPGECPICFLESLSINDSEKYLRNITGIPRDEVFAEIKKINKRRRKLYDYEYIEYALKKLDKTMDQMVQEVKDEFGSYDKFCDYLCKLKG